MKELFINTEELPCFTSFSMNTGIGVIWSLGSSQLKIMCASQHQSKLH